MKVPRTFSLPQGRQYASPASRDSLGVPSAVLNGALNCHGCTGTAIVSRVITRDSRVPDRALYRAEQGAFERASVRVQGRALDRAHIRALRSAREHACDEALNGASTARNDECCVPPGMLPIARRYRARDTGGIRRVAWRGIEGVRRRAMQRVDISGQVRALRAL